MKLVKQFTCVFLGGCLGGGARASLINISEKVTLDNELTLLFINLLGCFFCGIFFYLLEYFFFDSTSRLPDYYYKKKLALKNNIEGTLYFQKKTQAQYYSSFLITGFLGGFTTFSGYIFLSSQLTNQMNLIYSIINCLACPLSLWLGLQITKQLFFSKPIRKT